MTVQGNAFERKDRHLVTNADLGRPGAKRTRLDANLALIALAVAPQPVQVIQKYANLSVMAGLDEKPKGRRCAAARLTL
jgi:hypothetical protein